MDITLSLMAFVHRYPLSSVACLMQCCSVMRLTSILMPRHISTRTALPSRQKGNRCNSGFAGSTSCHTCGCHSFSCMGCAKRERTRKATTPVTGTSTAASLARSASWLVRICSFLLPRTCKTDCAPFAGDPSPCL